MEEGEFSVGQVEFEGQPHGIDQEAAIKFPQGGQGQGSGFWFFEIFLVLVGSF